VQERLRTDLKDCAEQLKAAQAELRGLPPRSLALEIAQGKKPDPALRAEIKSLVPALQRANKEAKGKILADWKKSLEGKPDKDKKDKDKKDADEDKKDKGDVGFRVAWAVYEEALQSASKPEQIPLLDELLREVQPEPQYVETLWLYRLASLPKEDWPAPNVLARALEAVRNGERAAACVPLSDNALEDGRRPWEPRAFRWVHYRLDKAAQSPLDKAAQSRHDGELLLLDRGFASEKETGDSLNQAVEAYKQILEHQDVLAQAYTSYDEALARLPVLVPYLMARPDPDALDEENWQGAVERMTELCALLSRPSADLPRIIGRLQNVTDDLQRHLRHFTESVEAYRKARLDRAGRPDDSAELDRIDALLELSWLKAEERAALWAARQDMAKRLQAKTEALDRRDDDSSTVKQTEPGPAFDAGRAEEAENQRALRRAKLTRDFFRLGGLNPNPELDQLLQEQETRLQRGDAIEPSAWPAVGERLRKGWTDWLPEQLKGTQSLAQDRLKGTQSLAQDRLSRLVQPLDETPLLDNAKTNPCLQLQREARAAQAEWFVKHFLYEQYDLPASGNDPVALQFYQDAANAYPEKPRLAWVTFPGPSEKLDLNDDRPQATYDLRITSPALNRQPVQRQDIQSLVPDEEALQVDIGDPRPDQQKTTVLVPLVIRHKPGGGGSGQRPKGFLVAVQADGWWFHHRVDVQVPVPNEKRIQVLVSTNPKDREDLKKFFRPPELLLRPNDPRQTVSVFVWNPPTSQDQEVVVEVAPEGEPEKAVRSKPKKIAPGKKERFSFEGKPEDKPQLEKGVLLVRVLDATKLRTEPDAAKKTELNKKRVSVKVVSPHEYLNAEMRFEPAAAGKKNRLVVRVWPKPGEQLSGKPWRVKMDLRIPGLDRFANPRLSGTLPPESEEVLVLSVEDLQFKDRQRERIAEVYLTVDEYPRAFMWRTTIAQGGPAPKTEEIGFRLHLDVPPTPVPDKAVLHVELDHPPLRDFKLRVSYRPNKDGPFMPLPSLRGERQQQVSYGSAGEDGLFFEASLKDHEVTLDPTHFLGERDVQVEMLDNMNGVIQTDPAQKVTIDNTPPENVKFLSIGGVSVRAAGLGQGRLPVKVKEVKMGAANLEVVAQGNDPESDISEVSFFFDKMVDGKLPDTAEKGQRQEGKDVWTAQLPLKPGQMGGPMDVTVVFVNRAGLRSKPVTTPINLTVVAPPPPPAVGSIKGTVKDPLRGERKEKCAVVLKNAMGKEVDKTKTDDKGEFVFEKVNPGTYTVSAEDGKLKGELPVKVDAGKESPAAIEVKE
jgi:hypothetical protein